MINEKLIMYPAALLLLNFSLHSLSWAKRRALFRILIAYHQQHKVPAHIKVFLSAKISSFVTSGWQARGFTGIKLYNVWVQCRHQLNPNEQLCQQRLFDL